MKTTDRQRAKKAEVMALLHGFFLLTPEERDLVRELRADRAKREKIRKAKR